jgi:hypothetical protein
MGFSMTPDGVLHVDIDPRARAPSAKVRWNLENTIYPYTIAAATLSARSSLGGEDRPIELAASQVSALAPGRPRQLASTLQLPVAQMPPRWSMAALKAAGSAWVLPGRIELHLAGQQLELSRPFRERMDALFPGDPLPDIFTPPRDIKESTVVLPLEVRVHYPFGPLVAAVGAAGVALLAAAGAAWAFVRPRRVQVVVDDELRMLTGRTGTTQPILDNAGNRVARLKTTLFGHELTDVREGAQVRLGRRL